ncbi:Mur ligase family protein [Nesterenkonia alba]|uniref:Mur ligase family protein n=1 Tax=Nesterenkonia alba TaxID=515814 RepID=UPI0003B538DC|nr:Mur ligase family protein [Nesterenkonia alba]
MSLRTTLSAVVGKSARAAVRLRGGSGSAFPGLLVEKLDPGFLARTLTTLPYGVVVVSGTNGKTTTTKMVVELLRGQGLRVFTNRSGSNFSRGVAASLLGDMRITGGFEADIAVLELDEAHAVHFVKQVPPRYCLLLNVMRDQLDRFGEIDTTAGMLRAIAEATTEGVVLNREDPRVAAIAEALTDQQVRYFGLGEAVKHHFPSDDDLHSADLHDSPSHHTASPGARSDSASSHHARSDSAAVETSPTSAVSGDLQHQARTTKQVAADVVLTGLGTQEGTFRIGGEEITTPLRVNGAYNTYNAAAALALVRLALGEDRDNTALLRSLAEVSPAFGRGESLTVGGQPLDLVLVKNPAGFRLGLSSFPHAGTATMIAINDNYADGRDMSWLWDVSFGLLAAGGVRMVSGVRAYDMALRLVYDDVAVAAVEPDLASALDSFIAEHPDEPKRIYCTYTAMLTLRRELARYTEVEAFA